MKNITEEALKSMKEMGGAEYAKQEAWDIGNAGEAIAFLSRMIVNELDEPDDVQTLANIMKQFLDFINGEIVDLVSAVRGGEKRIEITNQYTPDDNMNYSYVKSLHLENVPELAVKFVARDEIKAYSILWGNPERVDLEREYFTKDTNFWNQQPKWLTWDHAQDEEFKSDPRIGEILETGDDEWGKWYVARLKKSEAYRRYLDMLIEQKRIGSSSDSAPQYVVRERTGKSIWLKQWPLFAVSLTDNPCEPRMIGSVDYLKSLVDKLPETVEELGERNPVPFVWQAKDKMAIDFIKAKYGIY